VSLTDAELERYARHIVLPQVGGLGQRRLKEARIAVVGAGGIGSAVIPALAGALTAGPLNPLPLCGGETRRRHSGRGISR